MKLKSAVHFLLLPVLLTNFSLASFANSNAPLPELSASKAQEKTVGDVIKRLQARHYIKKSLNDSLSSQFFDSYLDKLDPARSLMLASDIEAFEQYRFKLDESLRANDLEPAFVMFNRYQQRLVQRLEKVIAQLPQTIAALDFNRDEYLELDRSDASWPKSEAELDEIWRKRIKSRVISLRLAGKPDDEITPLLQKRFENQLNRVKQSNAEDAFQIYINAFTALYDPHTNYLSPRKSENFNINMRLSLEGIGAVLQQEDEYTKVVRLVHAGPAYKEGQLQPSDRIVAVAQGVDGEFQDVIGLRLDEVVDLIRGPKGTTVRLEVIPVSAKTDAEHTVISIKRDEVKLEEQSAQKKVLEVMHQGELTKIGVIDIPAFYIDFDAMRRGDDNYKSTTRDVAQLLNELIDENVDGLIIDLRNNGGGSLQEANALTGLFIEAGPTVQIRHSDTRVYREGKRRRSAYYDGPMVVLINRLSASASEIFAGAIQDYQRGLVVGSPSFGKGTVQSLSPLEQGQIKLTESKFYRISGDSTQHRGVVPDIHFPSLFDESKVGESSLENALMWDKIDPVPHPRYHDFSDLLDQLKQNHQQRMKDDPDFVFMREQLKASEEYRDLDKISLNEALRREQQQADETRRKAMENKRRLAKGLAPLNDDGDNTEETAANNALEHSSIDENDPVLLESGMILLDALPAFQQSRVAQRR